MVTNKVLFINTNLIKPPIAPIGLEYTASCLEENGYSVEMLDLNFSGDIASDIRNKLKRESYLAIGISIRNTDDCYYLSQYDFLPGIKEILNLVRKHSDYPIILGGGGFSLMPLEILEELGADYGITGDGEPASLQLLDNIKNNKIIENPIKNGYMSLKHYPSDRRDIVDNERYFKEGGMGSIETRRGCDRNCIYCADPIIKGHSLRTRPIKTIICEIKNLLKKDVNVIHFCDSEFNLPADYAIELLKAIAENGLDRNLKWYSYMCPEYIDEEFVKLMKKSGCEGVNFGVDSLSSEILNNLGRNHNYEDLVTISELFKKYDIKFMFDLLLGGPGETKYTIKKTIEAIKKLDPTSAGISYGIRIYPGTKIAEIANTLISDSKNTGSNGADYLYGNVKENRRFIKPVFFISPEIGEALVSCTNEVVAGDERFFIGATENEEKNYNYNENKRLQDAIRRGYRGAYWDILRQIG